MDTNTFCFELLGMGRIKSRRATIEDLTLFKTIRLRSLAESPDAFGTTYEASKLRDDSSWYEQLGSTVSGEYRNMQFAFDDITCIGIAALYREKDAHSGDIIQMWVAPNYRGSKAASCMMQALLVWAKAVGFTSVGLCVTDTNLRAIQFYKNCGFELTGETVDVDQKRNLRGVRMKTTI